MKNIMSAFLVLTTTLIPQSALSDQPEVMCDEITHECWAVHADYPGYLAELSFYTQKGFQEVATSLQSAISAGILTYNEAIIELLQVRESFIHKIASDVYVRTAHEELLIGLLGKEFDRISAEWRNL